MSDRFRPFDADAEPSGEEARRARDNRRAAFRMMVELAFAEQPLSSDEVAKWHRQLLAGLSHVPHSCYPGGFRGSDHPWLRDYEVDIGAGLQGVPAREVAARLTRFFAEMERRIQELAGRIPPGRDKLRDEVVEIVRLAASCHGEWLQIHPFANGNGRVARLLANYVLARFRLAPVIRLRPRPAPPYTDLATASIRGDLGPLVDWIMELLEAGTVAGS